MAQVDTSIYGNLLARPKSVADYQAEYAQQDQNALALENSRQNLLMNRQKLDEYQRGVKEQEALRGYLGGGVDLSTPEGQQGLYKTAPSLAGNILKDYTGRKETEAKTAKELALTDKAKAEVKSKQLEDSIKAHEFHVQRLGGVNTPQDALAWAQEGLQNGVFTPDQYARGLQALQQASTNPQAFAQWKQQAMQGGMSVTEQLKAKLEQDKFGLQSNNELMMPDGKGGFVPNKALIGVKTGLASAGATRVTVPISVNTAKTLTAEMAGGLGKQLDASLAGALSAVQTINTADQIGKLVDSGKVITGPAADKRLVLARVGDALGVTGKDTREKMANTAMLMQNLAKTELEAASSMKGQGPITENERALLKRASSGDVNMSGAELKALSGAMAKTARARIAQHQSQVEKLKQVDGAAPIIPFYNVDMPPERAAPADIHSEADRILRGGK